MKLRSKLGQYSRLANIKQDKLHDFNTIRGAVCLGFLIGCVLSGWKYNTKTRISPPNAPEPIEAVEVVEVSEQFSREPIDGTFCISPIDCIRDIGEELGFSNQTIMTAIRIAKAESGMRVDAIGKNTNGTYDIGLFQINDVHHQRISRADRLDLETNIRFAYRLRKEQGHWNAWSVCRYKVDCAF